MVSLGGHVRLYGNNTVQQEHDKDFDIFCKKISLIHTQINYSFLKDNLGDYWLIQAEYIGSGDMVLRVPKFIKGIINIWQILRYSTSYGDIQFIDNSEERFKLYDNDIQKDYGTHMVPIVDYRTGGRITIIGTDKALYGSMEYLLYGINASDVVFKSFDISNIDIIDRVIVSSEIQQVDFSGIKFGKPNTVMRLVENCKKLKEIDISHIDLQNCNNLSMCFYQNFDLESVKLPKQLLPNNVKLNSLFEFCESLKEVNIQDLKFKNRVRIDRIFRDCVAIEKIDLREVKSAYQINSIIQSCKSLKQLILNEGISINKEKTEHKLRVDSESEFLEIHWIRDQTKGDN